MNGPAKGILIRLRGDRRGVSAVEFALIAPIMVMFYFAMSEFCQGFMAQKRMTHVASTVADLVAQVDSVTSSDIDDIFSVGVLVMKPFDAAPLKQRVSSLSMDDAGQVSVDWSRGSGMSGRSSAPTLPSGLIDKGESVIMAEVTYDYDSPVDYMMPGITQFSRTYYLRPRRVDKVAY